MVGAGYRQMKISQASGSPPRRFENAFSRMRALVLQQCMATAREQDGARDARLVREDALREAALSLSLGDGVPFTGREYQLIEQLWRIDP